MINCKKNNEKCSSHFSEPKLTSKNWFFTLTNSSKHKDSFPARNDKDKKQILSFMKLKPINV